MIYILACLPGTDFRPSAVCGWSESFRYPTGRPRWAGLTVYTVDKQTVRTLH